MKHHTMHLLLSLCLGILLFSCNDKKVIQVPRDTLLMNLKGNVKSLSVKIYAAEQLEKGYKMISMLESNMYQFDPDGMIVLEEHVRGKKTTTKQTRSYEHKEGKTIITYSDGKVEEVVRDLSTNTSTHTLLLGNNLTERVKVTINDKGLPTKEQFIDPNGLEKRRIEFDRNVYGQLRGVTVYLQGKFSQRNTYIVNKAGDPTQETEERENGGSVTRVYSYNYDGSGNWVRRVVRHMPKDNPPFYTVEERSIVYFH